MPIIKKLVLTFYPNSEKPNKPDLYYVCFQVLGLKVQYSFGYASWDGEKWDTPSDDCIVFMWTIEPNPKLLF